MFLASKSGLGRPQGHRTVSTKKMAIAVSSALFGIAAQAQTANVTLPEVTVTASPVDTDSFVTQGQKASVGKNRASIQDTPFSVSVIDRKQAAEMGATNIESALLYTAGVYAGRYGFDTRNDLAAIRGLSPSAYIDGLRGLYGNNTTVRPEFYTLERVEVLKGPSSVLYGQAELGGIINVVSKLPKSTPAREVEVQIGSHNRKQVAIDLTGPVNEDGTLLYRLVALKRNSDTQVDYVNDDALVLMPSLTWRPNTDTSVTVLYTHQKNNSKVSSQFLPMQGTLTSGSQGFIGSSRFAGEPGWDRFDTKKDELSLLVDHRLNEAWKAKANLRKTRSSSETREIWTRVGQIPDAAGNIQRTIYSSDKATDVWASDFRLEGDFRVGPTRHLVTVGLDYQNALWTEGNLINSLTLPGTFNVYNPVYGTANTAAFSGTDANDRKLIQTGLYLMDHMEWGPWVLSGAVRRDEAKDLTIKPAVGTDKVTNSATTGQVGLMYRFDNGISPYISTSEAFVPNLNTDGAGGYLKPTTGSQEEAGIKYLAPSGNTSIAFAVFDIKQKNRVVAGATPGGSEQVGSITEGWEIEAKHRIGKLELLANYTDMRAINDSTKKRLSSIAERTASAWAQYRFTDGWRAGIGSRYIGNVVGANDLPLVPAVTLLDAMVGYSVGKWDFRLNMTNLGDKEYVSWCRGLNQDCGYGNRRNVLLTANFKF